MSTPTSEQVPTSCLSAVLFTKKGTNRRNSAIEALIRVLASLEVVRETVGVSLSQGVRSCIGTDRRQQPEEKHCMVLLDNLEVFPSLYSSRPASRLSFRVSHDWIRNQHFRGHS